MSVLVRMVRGMKVTRAFVKQVVVVGVRPTLRRHGFKRPGGGSRFLRERDAVRQQVWVQLYWSPHSTAGRMDLWCSQHVCGHMAWSLSSPSFHFDSVNGDLDDLAIACGHWVESKMLPQLEAKLDFHRLAHAYAQTLIEPPEPPF